MKLFLNDTSPYARLVLATALELGLDDIELVWCDPWASPQALLDASPFSLVPTLLTDTGQALCESVFICDYLMALADGRAVDLRAVERRDAAALDRYATAKNLIDNAFRRVIMARFLGSVTDNELSARAQAALVRALRRFESDNVAPPARPDNADLCLAIAFDYLRFRLGDLHAAESGPAVRRWLAWAEARPSFQRSTPQRLQARPARSGAL